MHLTRHLEIRAKVRREQQQMPAINRLAAKQFKCLKVNREYLLQKKDSIIF